MKIPAIQGKIGETVYYSTNLTFEQIKGLVKKVDNELHTSNSLKEQIQRSLSDNHTKIRDYILNRQDHFFNALVLAVYDGEPKWTEIRYELEEESFHNVGVLELSGDEKIFPVDGQHRVEGIKAAIERNPNLINETIPVMLIGHSNTPQGMEKSRRIFSTLNRYAKTVRLGDIIALDEDDAVAIVTRDLLESFDLFKNNRIKATNSKSIPQGDRMAFTSLMTLYSCHFEIFKSFKFDSIVTDSKAKEQLRMRPNDDSLLSLRNYIIDFWSGFINAFEEIRNYLQDDSNHSADQYRSADNGGNIFFRPVSLLPFVQSIVRIKKEQNLSYEDVLNNFVNIDRVLTSPLWDKILWNANTNKMIMRNQVVVKLLLIYIYDESILKEKEINTLFEKYSLIHNIPIDQVKEHIQPFKL